MEQPDLTNEAVTPVERDVDRGDELGPQKKKFITPEVSVPVDVLVATTFFQAADSGATN